MGVSDDLAWLDGVAVAGQIRAGSVSAAEVVEAAIERIDAHDPVVNAVVIRFFDAALDEARRRPAGAAGPFAGVPFLWKDAGAVLAGMPLYRGMGALRDVDYRAPASTPLGLRFKAAGFAGLGKSAVPELAQQLTTQSVAFGDTCNPWAPDRSVGGSSGGAAAAVAAGMVPIAHGNDAGGSIRIPAAWCGVVGLKPSRGRIPLGGENMGGTHCEHVLTRSVRDSAAVLDAIEGPPAGELFRAPPPTRPFAAEVGADPGRLRIGVQTAADGVHVHAEAVAAAEGAARLLESLGHHVEVAGPESRRPDLSVVGASFSGAADPADMRLRFADLAAILGRPITEADVEPWTWARAAVERTIAPEDVLADLRDRQANSARMARWWDDFDVLVTPMVAEPPVLLRELEATVPVAVLAERMMSFGCFRLVANHTGHPAISLPLHWTADGLPLGVQFVGPAYRDDLVIRLAAQLEAAAPWAGRHPPFPL